MSVSYVEPLKEDNMSQSDRLNELKQRLTELDELVIKYADNPDMLQLVARQKKTIDQQMMKVIKEQMREQIRIDKVLQKKIVEKKKDKKKRIPLKACKTLIKSLRKVESIFDYTDLSDNMKTYLRNWFNDGIIPYDMFNKDNANSTFKKNAQKFIEMLKNAKMSENYGVLCSNIRLGRLYVKTKHGILSGRQAKVYLSYIIRTKTINPIFQYFKDIYNESEGQSASQNQRVEDDMYRILSVHQLFNDDSIRYMIEKITKESYDDDFSSNIQKIQGNGLVDELGLVRLTEEVKRDIIKSCFRQFDMDDLRSETSDSDDSDDDSDNESDDDSDSDSDSD